MSDRETAAAFATWQIAGPLEARGLFVERDGPVVTVEVDGVRYTVTVKAEPAAAAERVAPQSEYAKRLGEVPPPAPKLKLLRYA